MGAGDAARALRRALSRRQRALSSSKRGPWTLAEETKRAVAGLSTNSSTSPPSPRTSTRRPSSCTASTVPRSKPPPKCAIRTGAPTVGSGRVGPSTSRCYARAPLCAAARPPAVQRAQPQRRPLSNAHRPGDLYLAVDAPHEDSRHHRPRLARARHASAHGRGGHGRRPAELLPRHARGARRNGQQGSRRGWARRASDRDPAGPPRAKASHRATARGRRGADAGRATDVLLRRWGAALATRTT